MTTTNANLSEQLYETVGGNNREAKEMVDAFFQEISDCLVRGEGVKLAGFGAFSLRDKAERPGRNPKTGKEVSISAQRLVTFHASGCLKDAVDASPTFILHDAKAAQVWPA